MKNRIVKIKDIENCKNLLGNKTTSLAKLSNKGFNVPEFVALPNNISKKLFSSKPFRDEIVSEISAELKCDLYAVRSSALVEDCEKCSMAGQFLTKTNVLAEDLEKNIYEVLEQAYSFLNKDLSQFSIIVQRYILADVSGVAFTRNPKGNREMVIEHANCEGEKIVSGQVTPTKKSFYWDEKNIELPKFFTENNLIESFKKIENEYFFPQDIEWCLKDDKLYLLQSRTITTISKDQYEQIKFLDNILSEDEKYFYEKTEVSEIAPRPTNIVQNILSLIYADQGPVAKVYKKYNVSYESKNFLKIIGNESFVDKEEEIQGLLPAYSFLQNKDFSLKWSYWSESFVTIKNLFSLNKILTKKYDELFLKLRENFESKEIFVQDIETCLKTFLKEYKLIFEINLLASASIKKVELILKKEKVNFIDILNSSSQFVDLKNYKLEASQTELKGNSLNLADESDFLNNINFSNEIDKKVLDWWRGIPEYKRKVFSPKIKEAIVFNHLRELGRWLTVKNITALRNNILKFARKNNFENEKNSYFAELGEILSDEVTESLCLERKQKYDSFNKFNFPSKLTSSVVEENSVVQGVSSGVAEGILVDVKDVKNVLNNKVIVYTEILSPDLTEYFERVEGIISSKGGMLSHLAIMAREKSVPVVVGVSLKEFKLGDRVRIDGSSGEIEKID